MKIEMIKNILNDDRRAISRALTLIESTTKSDSLQKEEIITKLLASKNNQARVIGFSGVTGSGKSSLIEEIGKLYLTKGKKIAVLAVDPTSPIHGGSILGDKTRMTTLANHPKCFVRPIPSKFNSGGISRSMQEAVLIFEAAGYDYIFIETVGVGQTEYKVAEICDCFILNLLPATGDELQGVKKGINEVSDIILVNKADGALKSPAELTVNEYKKTLTKPILKTSVHDKESLVNIITNIEEFFKNEALISQRRKSQIKAWSLKLVLDEINHFVFNMKSDDIDLEANPYQNKNKLIKAIKNKL